MAGTVTWARSRVRWGVPLLFGATLFYFAIQTVVSPFTPEPYPAIYQPGFSGAPMKNGYLNTVEAAITVVAADGQIYSPEVTTLVTGTNNDVATFKSGFFDSATANEPETVAWLKNRLAVLYPGVDVTRVDVAWQNVRYLVFEKTREVVDVSKTVTVELGGDS